MEEYFPILVALSVAMLAWGVIEYQSAYQKSGQLPYVMANLRWACDYFMKCHTAPNVLYGQVGAAGPDHAWWGPCEVMQMARPSFKIDATHPGVGAWVSYGLGSENADLPGFVSLGNGFGQAGFERAGYLPGQFQATRVSANADDPEKMIRHLKNPTLRPDDQRRQLDALQAFNRGYAATAGDDPQLEARVRAMETAFRMQTAAGEAFDLRREPPRVRDAYGPGEFARGCLLARRLVERGVRFVQLSLGGWDHHANINAELKKKCEEIDRPIAALLTDLRQTGLLDDTLVFWGGEFGRTPVSENADGRDHNPFGFTMWMAGGGVKGGTTYGATDEFGFKAADGKVSVNDLHATILHLLGLDHEKLTYRYSGRDFRLTDVSGTVVKDILA